MILRTYLLGMFAALNCSGCMAEYIVHKGTSTDADSSETMDTTVEDTSIYTDTSSSEDTDSGSEEDTDSGSEEDTDTGSEEDTDTGSEEDTGTGEIEEACSDGVAEQIFSNNMVGCAGTVTWPSRDTLCALGWSSCSALEWTERRNGVAPAHNYWTSDNLGYNGTSAECSVSTTATYSCPDNYPMRVCSASPDPEGNVCNWLNCGYNVSTPNEYFGGCVGNETAGTVCCR